jgi:hypothetical protein
VLAQLPQPSCPVADVVLQQYLGKILGHLKKQLQVNSRMLEGICISLSSRSVWQKPNNCACGTYVAYGNACMWHAETTAAAGTS